MIQLVVPEEIGADGTVQVELSHTLPVTLGRQKVHITLKQGGKRVSREVIEVEGKGTAIVLFPVPEGASVATLSFAAFVGEDFQSNLQHITAEGAK